MSLHPLDVDDSLVDLNEERSLDRDDNGSEPNSQPVWDEVKDDALCSDDAAVVAKGLARLDAIIAQATAARADVADHLLLVLDGRRELRTDEVRVEVRRSTPRKSWKHSELREELDRRIAIQPRLLHSDGEVESEHARALRLAFDCLSPSWKVTGLRALGVNPDEFCETGEPSTTVAVWSLEEPW